MNKREFMVQYVLNRASTHDGGLEGKVAAKEAKQAWDYIQNELYDTKDVSDEFNSKGKK